jgi:predicted RNA-binding protein with RPS1 domain
MLSMIGEMIEPAVEANEASTPVSLDELKRKTKLSGTVKKLELYGAFIDIGMDVNALIHISKLGAGQVNRVSDVLHEGEEVTVWVEKVDPERQQVMVTMVEPLAVDWGDLKVGQEYTGRVTRLENFGAFVDIGAEREGLVHISELSHDYVKHPNEVLKVGDEVRVQVLNFSKRKRRIDLSIKALMEKPEPAVQQPGQPARQERDYEQRDYQGREQQGRNRRRTDRRDRDRYEPVVEEVDDEDLNDLPTAMEVALREAMGDDVISSVKAKERGSKKKRRKQRGRHREEQEELLSRTLQMQGSE